MLFHAGAMSEYDKRAHYISDNHKHVFEPMMKRCLDDRPSARGTFTDILGDVQDHLTRYSKNKHVETLDEKQVRFNTLDCMCAFHQGSA